MPLSFASCTSFAHRRLARLGIVEHRFHLVAFEVILEARHFRWGRFGVVHDRERVFLVVDLEADQPRLIPEHGLRSSDRLAGVGFAHRGDLVVERLQRIEVLRIALFIVRLVRGVDGDEVGDERLAGGLHIGRIVPEVRIVARFVANQRADHDLLAPRRLVGAEQLLHPGVVVDAVDDDHLGVGERLRRLGARLEEMRVVVGVRENARHRDIVAADLCRKVAVEVFGRHDLHRVGQSRRTEGAKSDRCDERKRFRHGIGWHGIHLLMRQARQPGHGVLCYNNAARNPQSGGRGRRAATPMLRT